MLRKLLESALTAAVIKSIQEQRASTKILSGLHSLSLSLYFPIKTELYLEPYLARR